MEYIPESPWAEPSRLDVDGLDRGGNSPMLAWGWMRRGSVNESPIFMIYAKYLYRGVSIEMNEWNDAAVRKSDARVLVASDSDNAN